MAEPIQVPKEAAEVLRNYVANHKHCRAAASALRRLRDTTMIPFLRDRFRENRPTTWEAAYALAILGDDGIVPFFASFEPPDKRCSWESRRDAAEMLGKIGSPRAIEALSPFLYDSESWQVRIAAMGALGSLNIDPVIAMLTGTCDSANPWRFSPLNIVFHYPAVRAVEALGETGQIDAEPFLYDMLQSSKASPDERFCAAVALCKVGSHLAVPYMAGLIQQGGAGLTHPWEIFSAFDALARLRDPLVLRPALELLEAFWGRGTDVNEQGLDSTLCLISALGGSGEVEVIRRKHGQTHQLSWKRLCSAALAALGDAQLLVECLRTEAFGRTSDFFSHSVRLAADILRARGLMYPYDVIVDRYVRHIRSGLRFTTIGLTPASIEYLAYYPHQRTSDVLLESLERTRKEPDLRKTVLKALGRAGGTGAVPFVLDEIRGCGPRHEFSDLDEHAALEALEYMVVRSAKEHAQLLLPSG